MYCILPPSPWILFLLVEFALSGFSLSGDSGLPVAICPESFALTPKYPQRCLCVHFSWREGILSALCRGEDRRGVASWPDLPGSGWWSLDFETRSMRSRVIFYNVAEKQAPLSERAVPPFSWGPSSFSQKEKKRTRHGPPDTILGFPSASKLALPASLPPDHRAQERRGVPASPGSGGHLRG